MSASDVSEILDRFEGQFNEAVEKKRGRAMLALTRGKFYGALSMAAQSGSITLSEYMEGEARFFEMLRRSIDADWEEIRPGVIGHNVTSRKDAEAPCTN